MLEKLKASYKKGIGFGLTSGIITTLGVISGLYSSTESKMVVIGGVLVIALADSLSDSFGIHISEELSGNSTQTQIWRSTLSTFITKAIVVTTFIIPILIIDLKTAFFISLAWGLCLIIFLSYEMGTHSKQKTYKIILEHVTVTLFVIGATYGIGKFIETIS